MELKRIFSGRLNILILLFIILNCMFFYKEQIDNDKIYQEESGYSYIEFAKMYNEALDRLSKVEYDSWRKELAKIYRENKGDTEQSKKLARAVNNEITNQMNYIDSYEENINKIANQAQKMIGLEIYSDKNSYGYHNILKTSYDLKKLSGTELNVSSNISVDRFFDYGLAKFFLMALMVITVGFFDISETGFKVVIRTTKRGRFFLNFQRLLIVFIFSMIYSILIYLSQLIISFGMYGGTTDVLHLIQSDVRYQYSTLVVSKFEYILMFVFMQGCGAIVIGLLCWLVQSLIREKNISFFTFILIAAAEYFFYCNASNNVLLRFLRYVNIFTYIDADNILGTYENWGKGTYIISRISLVAWSIVLCIAVLSVLNILYNTYKKTFSRSLKLPKVLIRLKNNLYAFMAGTPNFVKEFNKTMFVQKGYVIVILLLLYLYNRGLGIAPTLSDVELQMTEYYNVVNGDAYEASDQYISYMENWIKNAKKDISKFEAENNIVSSEKLSKELKVKEETLEEIREQVLSVRELNSSGCNAGIINQYNVENRYGVRINSYIDEYILAAILVVILMLFRTFYIERSTHMQMVIKVTAKGRGRYLADRILASCVICFICALAINLVFMVRLNNLFPVSEYEKTYCIQSIRHFEQFPFHISVWQFDVLMLVIRMVEILFISIIVMGISMLADSGKALAFSSILIIPHILCIIGFDIFEKISLVRLLNFWQLYLEQGSLLPGCLQITVLLLMSVLSIIVIKRKWNT